MPTLRYIKGFGDPKLQIFSAIQLKISRIDLYKIWVNDSFYNPVRAGGLGLCSSDLNRRGKISASVYGAKVQLQTFLNRTAN